MPIGSLAPGTKEEIFVDIVDNEGTVTDLSGSGPTFDVVESDGTTYKATAVSATASAMRITCLLDTNDAGPTPWAEGDYALFVRFTVGSQVIRKGPFYFQLVNF